MAASFQTIAAVLINDRTDKVIHNLLQTDTAFWSKLPVKGRSWSGDVAIIGLRVKRNGSVVSTIGNVEPKPGQQGFLRLTVQSKTVLARCQIDLLGFLAAEDVKGSLAVEPADELDNMLNDIAKQMTRYAFIGGGGLQGVGANQAGSPIGLVWQHSNVITTYGYHGRFDDIVVNPNNQIRFIRLDNYQQVGVDRTLTGISPSTITINANIDTSTLPAGVPCAVMVVGAASQAFNASTVSGDNIDTPCVFDPNGDPVGAFVGDPTGAISNLTQPFHFGNDRSLTDPLTKRIRSNFAIVNNTNAQGGDTLSTIEFLKLYGAIRTKSGKRPTATWMSWNTMNALPQSLIGTLDAHMRVMPQEAVKKMDPTPALPSEEDNDSGYGVSKVPIMCSELCPDGLAIAMRYESWERLFRGKEEGVWLGVNGPGSNPLVKLQGETQWGATRALMPEQVCTEPLSNGILVGIAAPV